MLGALVRAAVAPVIPGFGRSAWGVHSQFPRSLVSGNAYLDWARNLKWLHNMRSLLLASLAAFAFPGCVQDISGGKTGDDTSGATCGNGTVESGETCDDGNTASSDGCSSACQTESTTAPRVDTTLDRSTVASENNKTEALMLTVTSANGFSGTVTLAAAIADATSGTADAGVSLTVPATVDLTDGQTTTVPIGMVIKSDAAGVAANDKLTLTLTSSAGTATATAAVAIAPVFTVDYPDGTGLNPAMHPYAGLSFNIKKGTVIRFKNDDASAAATQHVIHGSTTVGAPFQHEEPANVATTQVVGSTYEIATSGAEYTVGVKGVMGCHTHGTTSYMTFTVD